MAKLDKEYFEKKIADLKAEYEPLKAKVEESYKKRAALKEAYRREEQDCYPLIVKGSELETKIKENEDLLKELLKEE